MNTKLTKAVRHLLFSKGYTGPRCQAEFGVGVTFYSEFMRGVRSGKPDQIWNMYVKLSGIDPLADAPALGPVAGLVPGAGKGTLRTCPPPPD